MRINEKKLRESMDRRLSGLDSSAARRSAVMQRIAQEEQPVMKKKMSFAVVIALVLVSLAAVALAATLIFSPRVDALTLADKALEEKYGITLRMQSFFDRRDEALPDGSVRVTYTSGEGFRRVMGEYTADVKDGKAEITWDLDGISTEGMFDARAWGPEQLKEIMAWNEENGTLTPYYEKAATIGGAEEEQEEGEPLGEDYFRQLDQNSADAKAAAKLTEEEMAKIAREALIARYGLTEADADQMEWYIPPYSPEVLYKVQNGCYCYDVEYLLGLDASDPHAELNGAYVVSVNVETGVIENMTYTAGYGEG